MGEERPALGIKPYYVAIPNRITDLAKAIIRNANETSGKCKEWATEIVLLSDVLEKISNCQQLME